LQETQAYAANDGELTARVADLKGKLDWVGIDFGGLHYNAIKFYVRRRLHWPVLNKGKQSGQDRSNDNWRDGQCHRVLNPTSFALLKDL
jgi:hypothetical protein